MSFGLPAISPDLSRSFQLSLAELAPFWIVTAVLATAGALVAATLPATAVR